MRGTKYGYIRSISLSPNNVNGQNTGICGKEKLTEPEITEEMLINLESWFNTEPEFPELL